jgi:surfactin synthase thioesterase subunit
MGQKLAEEVQKYIRNYMNKNNVILNFVGHSMGGIVARAGAKYLMKDYYNQFGFFCSLSSPHLGYLNGVDGMIKAGLWAILKFKPIKSLQQLKMDD